MARGHHKTSKPKNKLPGKGVLRMQFSYCADSKNFTDEDVKAYASAVQKMQVEGYAGTKDPATRKMMKNYIAGKPVYLKRPVAQADFEALIEAGGQRISKDIDEGRATLNDLFKIMAGKPPKKLGLPPTSGWGSPGWNEKLLEASDKLQRMIEEAGKERERQQKQGTSAKPPQPPASGIGSPGEDDMAREAVDRLGQMIDKENKARERRLKKASSVKPPKPRGGA